MHLVENHDHQLSFQLNDPLPGSFWCRATLTKCRFNERLCRIEFGGFLFNSDVECWCLLLFVFTDICSLKHGLGLPIEDIRIYC